MKKINPWLSILLFLSVGFIIWQNCSGNKSTKKIEIPEVKGSFNPVKPELKIIKIPVNFSVQDTSEINRLKRLYGLSDEEIKRLLAENERLDKLARNTNDSLQQQLYNERKYQEFYNCFENDTLEAFVTGLSRGPVEKLSIPFFTIKKRTIEVEEKQMYLRVIAGGEFGVNKELNQGTWKANVLVQDKNNNIWSGSYQRISNQQYFLVGINKSIFTLKK